MYFSVHFYRSSALWLLCVCLVELSTQRSQGDPSASTTDEPPGDEQFPHLMHLVEATKRVHIVSEIVHNGGSRIQVEEYLDVDTFSQLIQFKWHESVTQAPEGETGRAKLDTRKLSSLLLNKDKEGGGVLYHYEPYRCAAVNLESATPDSVKPQAEEARSASRAPPNIDRETWASLSPQPGSDSPFLTKLTPAEEGSADSHKWLSGVAGLWLKAEGAGRQAASSQPKYVADGELSRLKGVWRLELPQGLAADFYVEKMAKFGRGASADTNDAPTLIELRDKNNQLTHTINIFNVEFNYSDQLAKNLFTLPVGFDCPALHPSLASGIYFRDQRAQLMEFEVVATAFSPLPFAARRDDVKNIEFARAKHPMDQLSSLTMFRSVEDRTRIVQDNGYKLEYKIYNLGLTRRCDIEHLQFTEGVAKGGRRSPTRPATINPILVEFNNGIRLDLSEFNMDFLLGLHEADTSQMRLLNVFEVSEQKGELVFEAEVPSEHSQMVKLARTSGAKELAAGPEDEPKLRIVRVYDQEVVRVNSKYKVRRGLLDLARATLMVFSADARTKLAEVRFNLVQDVHAMSFARRAKLFDLSQCRDLTEESMRLVARYPADPELLQSISDQDHEILNSFYLASFDWLASAGPDSAQTNKGAQSAAPADDPRAVQKRRLGASLNFLRVPKLELKLDPSGELEIHMTVLEKNSPLDLFEHLPNCGLLAGDHHEQDVLVSSLRECAKHCLHFSCKVFAFGASKQCKMSRLPLFVSGQNGTGPACSLAERGPPAETPTTDSSRPKFARLTTSPVSDVYYEPAFVAERHMDEASLAEINSYLEHISEELDECAAAAAADDQPDASEMDGALSGDPFTVRQKRSAAPRLQPLFAFEFMDKSGRRSEYESPRRRLMVPRELSVEQLPPTLDVRAIAQANRVEHTFKVKFSGKAYKMTALDVFTAAAAGQSALVSKIRDQDERVFRDKHNERYYTLKRVASISQENCALMCYNLEELDRRTASEQVCVSFSYSRLEQSCVLLIRTDFKFVASLLELAQEGDIVHDIDTPDQLMADNFDAVLTVRRYLGGFEGPRALDEEHVAAGSTDMVRAAGRLEGLELEWLAALVLEQSQHKDDGGEMCAEQCSQRNRKGAGMCLGFDYCYTEDMVRAGLLPAGGAYGRSRLACNLLLVKNSPGELRSRELAKRLAWLRWHLATNTAEAARVAAAPADGLPAETTCSRYLVSHLREFNHLGKRQLNRPADGARPAAGKLEQLGDTLLDADQDSCALECAGLRPGDCLLFEFCQHVTEARTVERRCSLFRRTERRADEAAPAEARQPTSYHDGCHVFLRREFETLEDALDDQAAARLLAQQRGAYGFQHGLLTVWFSLTYVALVAGFVALYYARCRRKPAGAGGAAGSSSRPGVSFMMSEISAPR